MTEVPRCPKCSRMPASQIIRNELIDERRYEQIVVWICGTRKCPNFMREFEPEWVLVQGAAAHQSDKR